MCNKLRYKPDRINLLLKLQRKGLSKEEAIEKAAKYFKVSPITIKWDLYYYQKSLEKAVEAAVPDELKRLELEENCAAEPRSSKIYQTQKWLFADNLLKRFREGTCIEVLAKQYKLSHKTIADYIELAKIFPRNLRFEFFSLTTYRKFLRFSDPVKALKIALQLRKISEPVMYRCINSFRKPNNKKIPVEWLEDLANKYFSLAPVPNRPVMAPIPQNFMDLQWIKEIQDRVAQLERELAVAKKLNYVYLCSLERNNKLRQVYQN